jgi:methionyl aminopeptidase
MIELKSPREIERMRGAARITAEILAELRATVRPGVTTGDLDRRAERLIEKSGARSAFKGYQVGAVVYPKVLCVAVNDEVVHGIPSDTCELADGDIISLDFGVEYDGFYGDCAVTVPVGDIDPESARLLEVTRGALEAGIAELEPGKKLGDVGARVQKVAEEAGFSVVLDFVGHGIGRALHEDPQVPNFGKPGRGRTLKPGMVLAVEPMVNMGTHRVKIDADGWTARTVDGKRSAHFEHTIAITDEGPEVLTVP